MVGHDNRRDKLGVSRVPIPKSALKIKTGSEQYSDLEMPYTAIARSNWSSGRGLNDSDQNATRFYDSHQLNTQMQGRVILGGQETYTAGQRDLNQNLPGPVAWVSIGGPSPIAKISQPFTASAQYNMDKVCLWLRRVGNPGPLTLSLTLNSGGNPGTVLRSQTVTTAVIDDIVSVRHYFDLNNYGLTNGTIYHLMLFDADYSSENHWEVGVDIDGGTARRFVDQWSAAAYSLYYRVVDVADDFSGLFFNYKKALYCATRPFDGGAAKLLMNGYQGTADSNSSTLSKLFDSTQTAWAANSIVGGIVIITKGPGVQEIIPWRVITASASGGCTVTPDWNIAHTTATEYSIIGLENWEEISTTELTVPVTDAYVAREVVYLCLGENVNVEKYNAETSGGNWVTSFTTQTGPALFAIESEDRSDGQQVIIARNNDVNGDRSIVRGKVTGHASQVVFGDPIIVGDRDFPITGLALYGDPQTLWVFKENKFFEIVDDVAIPIQLPEMGAVASMYNGRASLAHGPYIYFSLLYSLQRYFRGNLDDMGPWLDDGLPSNRQGPIIHMAGYPGKILAVIDGGENNYSSVLENNMSGWHEIYRAPIVGKRITRIHFQPIPGETIDRLWISEGSDLLWVPYSSNTLDPYQDSNYRYVHEGVLETGWFYDGMKETPKFWHALTLMTENLTADAQEIFFDFKTDDETAWTTVDVPFNESPFMELLFSEDYSTSGRRIKYRLRIKTNDNTRTPKLLSAVIEGVARIKVKFMYGFTARVVDEGSDLQGDEIERKAKEIVAKLEEWGSRGRVTPLMMDGAFSVLQDKPVFLDPILLNPVKLIQDDDIEGYKIKVNLVDA
ncbi:MAG: hypothetical protein FVQ79_02195 [Planctomycetes bacterium]|nr:hypothetical protein [Planctomycetota bacterium]